MGAAPLLSSLEALGAIVSLRPDGKIRVEAPEGVLREELRAQLHSERDALAALLGKWAPGRERKCGFASVASAASVSRPERETRPTVLTEKAHVCSPILARHNESETRELASVSRDWPEEWREGLQRLATMPPPAGFGNERWSVGVWWTHEIARRHWLEAHAGEWATLELFGLHPIAPATRYDAMGVAFLLRPGDTIVLAERELIIQRISGAQQRQRPAQISTEAVPAWTLG